MSLIDESIRASNAVETPKGNKRARADDEATDTPNSTVVDVTSPPPCKAARESVEQGASSAAYSAA